MLDQGTREAIEIDRSKGDFHYPESHKYDAGRGLTPATVDYICDVLWQVQQGEERHCA